MSKWIDVDLNERQIMIRRVSQEKNFADSAAEKDWWVTLCIKAIFSMPYAPYMLFKGGTSLSKGWNIISRFSEDIDLTISQRFFLEQLHLLFANCENNQQIKKLRIASRDFITEVFCPQLNQTIRQLGVADFVLEPVTQVEKSDGTFASVDHDSDPTTLLLKYTSIATHQYDYVSPVVKIEISCLGMDEPFEVRRLSSLISEYFPEEDDEMIIDVPTVMPTRTFLEKAFLLNEEFQRNVPRSLRMSRHLYDLEKIMSTPYAAEALQSEELYDQIVAHRRRFYHVGGVDYDKDMPKEINFIPQGELASRFRADYEAMLHTYIYDQTSALTYDELIQRLEHLQEQFRSTKAFATTE